jgi:hypothetical protein
LVLFASADDGVKVAVVPEYVTVPATVTEVAVFFRVKVVAFTVDAESASLNTAFTAVPGFTFVAEFAGAVELTVGGVVSVVAATVKELVETLSSPWLAAVVLPESYRFPNQAAAKVYVPGADGAVPVIVMGNPAPPPLADGPVLLSTSALL